MINNCQYIELKENKKKKEKKHCFQQSVDLRISNRTQNLKMDFVAYSTNWKSMTGRISIYKIRGKLRFQVLS